MKRKIAEKSILYITVAVCTLILLSLCFNDGLDYDEAFSYSMIHGRTLAQVPEAILNSPYQDVAPLWYMGLKVWTMLFGDNFVVCKFFTVAGSVATMLLGATIVYRKWGFITALLYLVPAGLAPGLMHIGVNIRTYSWTVFIVTLCGLIAYGIVRDPGRKSSWAGLFLTTAAGLFCHHFTAFCYFFIYLYLFVELLRYDRKKIVGLIGCGTAAVALFSIWLVVSDFFRLANASGGLFSKVQMWEAISFVFYTSVPRSYEIGILLLILVPGMFIVLHKRFTVKEIPFLVMCFIIFWGSYLLSAMAAASSDHFVVPRHTVHALALFWLAFAIVIPRINKGMTCFWGLFLIALCSVQYEYDHAWEYDTIPYLQETYAFIEDSMEAGDIVIFDAMEQFETVYQCYMPDQKFVWVSKLQKEDLPALWEQSQNVWFFLCTGEFLPEEWVDEYGITWENEGHYGFQIMDNNTDFDLLRLQLTKQKDGME